MTPQLPTTPPLLTGVPGEWQIALVAASAASLVTLLITLLLAGRGGADVRLTVERRLAAFAEQNSAQFGGLQDALSRRLDQTVGEHLAVVRQAVADVRHSAAEIADLRRLFSSVRARGAWGESQLRSLLDDVLPAGSYETDCRVREGSGETVEFAVRMPAAGVPAARRPLLAIDAKFPTEAYDRLLNAEEAGDTAGIRAARRDLEAALRAQARRIAGKYIAPPTTVDYAILYLPTDGLYVEAARLPGLLDELGRAQRVLVMGPAILPGLLRSIHLGAMTLALGERAEAIARLLGTMRHEIGRLDENMDRLKRHAAATVSSVEEASRRSGALGRRLADAAELGKDELPLPLGEEGVS